jgi:hypothetical protein
MLRVPNCVFPITGLLIAAAAWPLAAGVEPSSPSLLTVIMEFKGPHSPAALKEMKRESGLILGTTGIKLDWKMPGQDPFASYSDLVVMRFKGSCEFEPAPPRYDELGPIGPLATTRTINGEVQPFGEVNCDRVVNSARGAMSQADWARGDLLIGRAMGRVVAHELVHMLTRSGEHGSEGVEKPALSGRQLIAASLPLSAFDIDRLRQERKGR